MRRLRRLLGPGLRLGLRFRGLRRTTVVKLSLVIAFDIHLMVD
jgi:hypothetical protein